MNLRQMTIGAVLGAAALAVGAGMPAKAETFNLTIGSSHPPIVPWVSLLPQHVVPESTRRAKELGHEIVWTEAYSGTLYNFDNTLEGVEDGLADVGWVGTLWEPIKMPLHNVTFAAPFGAGDLKNLQEIAEELHEKVPAMNEQWHKFNQVLLGPMVSDNYVFLSQKPIETLDDLKGLKVGVTGMVARWLEGTGAVPVNVGLPVIYNSLSTGVIDAVIPPISVIVPFKLFEVAPYVTQVQLGASISGALTMNKDSWDKLPPEMQEMFLQVGKEYSDKNTEMVIKLRDESLQTLRDNPDVTVSEMPIELQRQWAAIVPNIPREWAASDNARDLPAAEVLKAFMEGTRARGETPLRDWDKEID